MAEKQDSTATSLANLMETFIQQQQAFNKAISAEMKDIRTGQAATTDHPCPPDHDHGSDEPKAKGKTPRNAYTKAGKRKKTVAKRDLDVAQYASQKHPVSSDKAIRKVKAWADAGNIARLHEYAGSGPRANGEGDPRVAVTEGNRALAANVIAKCFTKAGKANGTDNAAKVKASK